jgi:hypothetical protein
VGEEDFVVRLKCTKEVRQGLCGIMAHSGLELFFPWGEQDEMSFCTAKLESMKESVEIDQVVIRRRSKQDIIA